MSPPQTCKNQPTEVLAKVHQLICEHLEQAQLLGSRGAFIHECGQLGLPILEPSSVKSPKKSTNHALDRVKNHLCEAFDNANSPDFFEIWNDPQSIAHTYGSKTYVKLNFRLQLHFNCRLVTLKKQSLNECMLNIRQFFEREGAFLAAEQEFIHFFALPFVIEPAKHPSFQSLFEGASWMRLRSDLTAYLDDIKERSAHESDLAKLVKLQCFASNESEAKNNEAAIEKDNEIERMRQVHSQLVTSHQKLRNDHQKLIAVTKELTTALELAAKSASSRKASQSSNFTWSSIVLKCGRIYPELFAAASSAVAPVTEQRASTSIGQWTEINKNRESNLMIEASKYEESKQAPTQAPVSRPKSSPLDHHRQSLLLPPTRSNQLQKLDPPQAEKLNYRLIQQHIADGLKSRQNLLLLQALRWLLTRSTNGDRKVFLSSYLRSDILGLKKKDSTGCQDAKNHVVEIMSTVSDNQENGIFHQSVVRLMNAMASIKCGRDYLAGNYRQVVSVLINSLVQVSRNLDQFTIDMIVATLQKLSLKYLVRRQLIESGMIEWLIDHLKQFIRKKSNLSCYGLEYSTALFMNLCLHRSGKLRCLPLAQDVLSTFLDLLSSSNKRQILPYVNGTLYSLLTNPKIAATAKQLHISEKLKLAITATANDPDFDGFDDEARQQISFVLQQYEESSSSSSTENSSLASSLATMSSLSDDGYEEDEESNDEDVEIEDEVDLYDPVVPDLNELSGNALLCAHYLIKDEDNDEENQPDAEELIEEDSLDEDNKSSEDGNISPSKEKILEEEYDSGSRSANDSKRNSLTASGSDGASSPRQPCSFFISTSPPLPALGKASIASEISSTSSGSNEKPDPTPKAEETSAPKAAAKNEGETLPPVKNNSSDTDEGVVLVMEDTIEPPKAPIKRPNPKKRSKSMSRKNVSNNNLSNNKSRQNSASQAAKKKAGSSKSRSPMRTELPKIESPPTTTAGASTAGAAETSTELPVVTKESHLLNKVAAALPLLPPLPTTEPIDHTKHAGDKGNFSMAGADAFNNGSRAPPLALTHDKSSSEERSETIGYLPPPSPRKRWRKLEPVPLKTSPTTTLL